MQHDIELMRRILLAIEAAPRQILDKPPAIAGFDDKAVFAHLAMLREAGLVDAKAFVSRVHPYADIKLTEPGRDILQAEREGLGDLSELI